jgi:hypothetical protein
MAIVGQFASPGFWALADVPAAATNVCFEGKNGHAAGHSHLCLVPQTWTDEGENIEVMLTYLMTASHAVTGGENFV